MATPTPTLNPEAQKGLDYLKSANPTLAASVMTQFSQNSAAATPINASVLGNTSNITVPPAKQAPIPPYGSVQVTQYRDNPDGTTTNTLSDDMQSTVKYTTNSDGSLTPTEVPTNTTSNIANTPEQDRLQTEKQSLVSDITATGDKLATKNARKSELETAQGIPGLDSQLNEINNQIRSIQSEALAATNKSEDRLAPTFAITGEQAAIERQRAVRVYGLSAAAEAIQGNIALANDNVTRALDAEFGGLEQEIENKKFLLSINMDNFDKEEKRAAETRQTALDQQKDALAQQRQDKQSIYEIMLEAAKNGADNITLNKIQSAQTPDEAISLAGEALTSPKSQVIEAGGRVLLIDEKGNTLKDLGATTSALSGGNPKPPTPAQETAANYASRLVQADDIINSLSNDVTGIAPASYAFQSHLPTALQSATLQQYDQAKRNFVNAVLRQESGAAISPSEFDSAEQQYFPQPGDSAQVIQQKAQNRALVIRNFQNASGSAYEAPPQAPNAQYQNETSTLQFTEDSPGVLTKVLNFFGL